MAPVWILTAYAQTPSGGARYEQMEVVNNPPFITNAAVDSRDNVVLNGQLTVDGFDNCTCTCPPVTVNGKTTVPADCANPTGGACDKTKYSIFAAGNIQPPNASETLLSGQTAPGYIGNQAFPYDIPSLIANLKPNAVDATAACPATLPQTGYACGYTCTAGSPNNACGVHSGAGFGVPPTFPPTPPGSPVGPANMFNQITYIPGNLQTTAGSQGNGILIIDGDLDIHGGLQFYGLILVRGVIKFTGGGSASTNIYGAVLAGQESYVDNTLGGSAVIHFDSCALASGTSPAPPKLLSFREISF